MFTNDRSVASQNGSLSTGELISQAAAQVSTLVRDELALAQGELIAKGKKAGVGGGLIGAAAVLTLFGTGLVLALIVVAFDMLLPLWAAILIVAAVVLAVAGIAALMGRNKLRQMTPPVPSEALAGVTADMQTVKTAVRQGRQS